MAAAGEITHSVRRNPPHSYSVREKTLSIEMGRTAKDAKQLADFSYSLEDIGARLASGSSRMDAMVVAPCSIHTMSAIAAGLVLTY